MARRARLTMDIEGIDDAVRAIAEAGSAAREAAEGAVGEEAEAVADDMRAGAPYDTGELHDSIEAEHDGLEGSAQATARHAEYVEEGTSRTPAQPFAQPASVAAEGRFPDRVADAIRGAVE
jgi:HK97 gp10 family phage protein